VDCATGSTNGNISPLPPDYEGPWTTLVFQTLDPAVGVQVTAAGWPNCQLGGGSPDTCTMQAIYPLQTSHVTLTLTNPGPAANVGVEVTAVSSGPYVSVPPAIMPTGSLVTRSLCPGRTLAPGQAAQVGAYRLVMRRDGHLAQYVARGQHHFLSFDSGTSAPGSRLVVRRDGSVIVRSRRGRALWRSQRPGGATQGEPRPLFTRAQGLSV
jgi:hypothetical protein